MSVRKAYVPQFQTLALGSVVSSLIDKARICASMDLRDFNHFFTLVALYRAYLRQ